MASDAGKNGRGSSCCDRLDRRAYSNGQQGSDTDKAPKGDGTVLSRAFYARNSRADPNAICVPDVSNGGLLRVWNHGSPSAGTQRLFCPDFSDVHDDRFSGVSNRVSSFAHSGGACRPSRAYYVVGGSHGSIWVGSRILCLASRNWRIRDSLHHSQQLLFECVSHLAG